MSRFAVVLAIVMVSTQARAEGVESRVKLPSNMTRIHGASSVVAVPWGLVAMGGSPLRHMPTGKKKWETLHTVKDGNLYRIASDKTRLLASWEEEDKFHLFVIKPKKKHLTFAKPAKPGPELMNFTLDDIFFAPNGDAIVFMHGQTGGYGYATVGYRYKLDGKTPPTLLFNQAGFGLHQNAHTSIFLVPKDPKRSCDSNGCTLESIVAWQITDAGAKQTTLLSAGKDDVTNARLVWGSEAERVAIITFVRPPKGPPFTPSRHLLSWHVGDAKPEYRPLPKHASGDSEWNWLTKSGDLVEVFRTNKDLEIRRHTPKGEMTTTALAAFPDKSDEERFDPTVRTLKDRANGELFMGWGDYLVLLGSGKPPRFLDISGLAGPEQEMAGAFIYVQPPEALWIGIEVGEARDFVKMTFADIEKRALPREALVQQ